MSNATLKITLRNGTTETFSEPVGKSNVDYEEMDKALHRLQEKSNAFLTVHVEKEKEINKLQQKNGAETTEVDDEESSDDDDEEDENDEDGKPPEKKLKT